MPPKATTQDPRRPIRLPQQHVRAGRGVPGYTGKVEVYDTPVPKSFQGSAGVVAMSKRGEAAANDMSKWSREKLDERAVELGLNPEDYANKDAVRAAIEEKE